MNAMADSHTTQAATFAEGQRYLALGWKLCLLRPRSKVPFLHEWNDPLRVIGTEAVLQEALNRYPQSGLGLVHEHSGTGTLDIDHVEYCQLAFMTEFGINLAELFAGFPRIKGRNGHDKYLFRLPAGVVLETKKLVWPARDADQDSPDPFIRNKKTTLLELRGKGGQDALPPTIHPDTLQPFVWLVPPWDGIPELPAPFVAMWQNWGDFHPQLMAACPWAKIAEPAPPPAAKRQVNRDCESVISQFNARYSIQSLLADYGYKPKGKRWLCPSSTTGIPGVVVLPESGKCYSHHASDVLNDGHAHDAFDVFCLLEMAGSFPNALSEARLRLNLTSLAVPLIDTTELLKNAQRKGNKKPLSDAKKPIDFPEPFRGPMAWATEIAIKNAFRKQPRFCMMSSLAGMAAGCHGGYKQPDETRHNCYMAGYTLATAGKTSSSKVAADIASLAGADILGNPSSGAAIEDHLKDKGSILMDWDEVAHLVEAINDSNQPHKRDIGEKLLKLSGASSGIYRTRPKAKMDRNDESTAANIANPCLTVLGFSTTDKLGKVVSEDNIKDGLLGRFIFFEGEGQVPLHRNKGMLPYPDALIKRAQEIKRTAPCVLTAEEIQDGLTGGTQLADITVQIRSDADQYLDEFLARLNAEELACKNPIEQALLGRTYEKIIKISGVLAIWDNPTQPVMMVEHIEWAIRLIRASNHCALSFVEDHLNHGAVLNEARSIIKIIKKVLSGDYQPRNAAQARLIAAGKAPHSLVLKKSRIKADLFNTAVMHAISCGDMIGGIADDSLKTKWLGLPSGDD